VLKCREFFKAKFYAFCVELVNISIRVHRGSIVGFGVFPKWGFYILWFVGVFFVGFFVVGFFGFSMHYVGVFLVGGFPCGVFIYCGLWGFLFLLWGSSTLIESW
jgi:hypothetical protein